MSDQSINLSDLRAGGTEVNYYVHCPRELWWFCHGLEQEHVAGNVGSESVALGRLQHEDAYPDRSHREVMVDDLLRLDFTDAGQVHELKKSRGGQRAALVQLMYYLYYLKHEKGMVRKGVLEFPKQRRREEVELTPQWEAEVEEALRGVESVREMPTPPPVPEPMSICKKCSYQDLCWG